MVLEIGTPFNLGAKQMLSTIRTYPSTVFEIKYEPQRQVKGPCLEINNGGRISDR